MQSYTTGPPRPDGPDPARGGSIWVGGVLGIALAAALPRFLRYDGTNGLTLEKAADEAWIAAARRDVPSDYPEIHRG